MPLGRIEQVSSPPTPFWRQHELLGHHLGLGVEVVESLCVGQGFVAVGDALTAHHHAVGRGVDEPLDTGRLCGAHQVLGAADVDGEAALAVLLGDRGAAHQVDDRRGVEDGVDALRRPRRRCRCRRCRPRAPRSRGCSGSGEGARSNERTSWPRSSSSVTRLAPTKPEPPVTRTRPSSVVSVASPMPASITETCSSFDHVAGYVTVRGQPSASSRDGQRVLDALAGSG